MPIAIRKIDTRFAGITLLAITLFVVPLMLHAQSTLTAEKPLDISVFGGYIYLDPDIGKPSDRGNGVSVGADVSHSFGWHITPSFEVRANYADAPFASESTVLFGLRVKSDFRHRFHPYADFLFGAGHIIFTSPPASGYRSDKSVVYSYGGGMDFDVHGNFGAKIDFQAQNWNMGLSPSVTASPTANFTLAPMALVVGVTYHIPFRPPYAHQH